MNEAALTHTVAIRYLLPPQAILQGTVTDKNDGLPIAGASVKAFLGSTVSAQTTTDANGFYRMALLPGTYDLQALKTNYVTALAYGFWRRRMARSRATWHSRLVGSR